jgi:hypothetical protein
MTMATKAATGTPSVQSEIDRIREEIRTHEVAILGLKQELAELKGKLPKSKMALAEEIYLKHPDEPRPEVIKARGWAVSSSNHNGLCPVSTCRQGAGKTLVHKQ